MKNRLIYLSLIILPILLYILVIYYRYSIGPSFLYSNYDGPYGLLLSSLSIADLRSPGFFQHPGIVPQLVAAVVIKLTYIFQGIDPSMVMDTIIRPEFYMTRVNLTFTFVTMITLIILGVIAYKKIANIFAAIFIQFTPFISVQLIYQLAKNTAESTSVILILILLCLTISLIFEKSLTKTKNLIYIFSFSIVCGLALANKVSFLPVMIIPFLLIKKIRFKSLFVLSSFSIFSILFISFCPDIMLFFKTHFKNIFSSGVNYSSGPANFAESSQIFTQSKFIFYEYTFFSAIYVLMILTLLLQFVPKFRVKIRSNKFYLLMVGIIIVKTVFIFLVVKSHVGYYILPALMFSVIGLFAINSVFYDLFPRCFKICRYFYIYMLFITFASLQIKIFQNSTSFYSARKFESYKVIDYLKANHKNELLVSTDFASSLPTALYHSLLYTGTQRMYYYSILKDMYPNFVYFQKWRKEFVFLGFDIDLNNRLMNSDSLVFHCYKDENFNDFKAKLMEYTKKPNTTFTEIYTNGNGEKIYLVRLNPDKSGDILKNIK